MRKRTILRGLVPLLLAFLALPAAAQLGYSTNGWEGMRARLRYVGKGWENETGNGSDTAIAGARGERHPIDGLSLRYYRAKLRYQVKNGDQWQGWKDAPQEAGVAGKPIVGLRAQADLGSVRYRALFAGNLEWSEWVRDGVALEGNGIPIEAVEIAYSYGAKPGETFKYRAAFRGEGFGPWQAGGEIAKAVAPDAELTALELEEASGIRTEVFVAGRGWKATVMPGRPTSEPDKYRVEGVRFYSDKVLLRYRVKTFGRDWSEWCITGDICGEPGHGWRIEAIQLKPDFTK